MLQNAGGILFALVLVLFSFLSYWLVWSLNGVGKSPTNAVQQQTKTKRVHRTF
jgi:hypothetical protein